MTGEAPEHDLRSILRIQAIRAYLYGLGSVLIGATLADGGLSDAQVGVVFTAILGGMALGSLVVGTVGERVGRRRIYTALLLLMGAAGAVFALTLSLPALVVAALSGCLSTDPNESGPITSTEQAMIGEAPSETRLRVFGRYNAIAYLAGAVGALSGALPGLVGVNEQRFLLLYPVLAVIAATLARRMSPAVETHAGSGEIPPGTRPLVRSRGIVARLASLFALDSFAGGFVVQSFVVFWFGRTFGASTEFMGVVFFASGLLQAASSVIASRVALRFGMLRTMVFTHLPSNVLLMLVPLAPGLAAAVALWLARISISQMDVPARQAYVVALVDPPERIAASAYTNTARYLSRPIAPALAGALMQAANGLPFAIAGGLKIAYDLLLYSVFRNVSLPTPRRE
jgi:predicted MFS family arabinose efflux permease